MPTLKELEAELTALRTVETSPTVEELEAELATMGTTATHIPEPDPELDWTPGMPKPPYTPSGGFQTEQRRRLMHEQPGIYGRKDDIQEEMEGDLEEDWTVPAVIATGPAAAYLRGVQGLPTLGRTVHGIITAGTAAVGEYGIVQPLQHHAGRVHPALKVIVGIVGGIGSAVTLEALLSEFMIKSLTKSAPKFWTNQLVAMKSQTSIPHKFLEDQMILAKRADNEDIEAARELQINLYKKAHHNITTKSEKKITQLFSDYAAKQISTESPEKLIKELSDTIKTKGHLNDVEYRRLAKIAERDAIHEYTEEFDALKKTIINERAGAEWGDHPTKEMVDHIVARGGLDETEVRNLFQGYADAEVEKIIGAIKKRFPKIFTTEDSASIIKIAQELDQFNLRKLIADIADAPGLKKITKQKEYMFRDEFDRVYRDEIFIRAQEKLSEYLSKVLGVEEIVLPPPGALRKGFTLVGEAVKELEAGAPVGRVVDELVSVRDNIMRMTNIIRKQTASLLNKEGRVRLQNMRQIHRREIAKFKELSRVQKNTIRIRSRFKSVLENKGMDPGYHEQIQNFLAPLMGRERLKLDENMFQFLKRKYDDELSFGADIVANYYNNMIKSLGTRPFRFNELTYNQLENVDDFVKSFVYVAKQQKMITVQGRQMFLDALAGNIEATAKTAMPKIRVFRVPPVKTQLEDLAQGELNAVGRFTKSTVDLANGGLAELKRMENILRQLDGFEEGLAHTTLFRSAADAEISAQRLGDDVFNKYKDMFEVHRKAVGKGRSYWRKMQPEVAGIKTTKESAVAIALNTGNEGNLTVLMKGLGKTKKEINEYLAIALNDADWKLVNDVWDHLEKDLWPIISKVHKEMTGRTLQKIKGRYYPIHQDLLYRERQETLTDIMLSSDPTKHMENVELAFTCTRIGGSEHLKLTLDPLVKHLRDVVHTTTHWKMVNDAQRLIRNPKFKNAVESTMGEKIYQQFEPWVSRLARPSKSEAAGTGDAFLRWARGSVTIGVLGLVPTTGAKQSLSLITALPEVGVMNTMVSLNKFGGNPIKFVRDVMEASPQMQYRIRNWNREIAEMKARIKPKDISLRGGSKNIYFAFIHAVDRMTASIVWHGAYLKGLDKFNGNAHRAIYFADGVVRRTQPSSAVKDLPRVLRSAEWKRTVFLFSSYFSVWHNQASEIVNRGLAGNMSIPQVTTTLAVLAAGPVVAWELMSAMANNIIGRKGDLDELGKNIAIGTTMMGASGIPIGRDMVASALKGYNFKLSPVAEIPKEAVEIGEGIYNIYANDKEWERKHTASTIELGGYLLRLPSRQTVTTVEGAWRLLQNETNDPWELLIRP